MRKFSEKISFKIFTFILVFALLMPTGLKFSHIFLHQHHEVCHGETQTHLHNADLDCSFYQFNLSTPFTIPTFEYQFVFTVQNHQNYGEAYSFLSEYQQLHFSLRGPPQIVFI